MSIIFGKYSVLVNPIHHRVVKPISDEQIKEVKRCLGELAEILDGDFSWVLSGGLAIPATKGTFYRVHGDIDIGLHQDDVFKLTECTKNKGYSLVSRKIMAKISSQKKLDIYKEVTPEEALENKCENLRLVRKDEQGRLVEHKHLLDYFDVYLHHFESGFLVSKDGKMRIPSDVPSVTYTTLSGKEIMLRPLEYIVELKKDRRNEIDQYDINFLAKQAEVGVLTRFA